MKKGTSFRLTLRRLLVLCDDDSRWIPNSTAENETRTAVTVTVNRQRGQQSPFVNHSEVVQWFGNKDEFVKFHQNVIGVEYNAEPGIE